METQTPNENQPRKQYWKSIQEWENDPKTQELIKNEFLSSPLAEEEGSDQDSKGSWARREFMKLMGASLALGSFGCIRRPVQKIVPYAKQPEEVIPGVANYYSSSFVRGGEGFGLVIKTREGRPIKLEGNPSHPVNQGALSARAQAHILSLYDPDRAQGPMKLDRNGGSTKVEWDDLDKAVTEALGQGKFAVLSSSLGSPTTQQAIRDFLEGSGGRHYVWDPISADDVAEGQKASYGAAVVPRFRLEAAKMIVSVDADILGTYLSPTEYSRGFAAGRRPEKGMSKLISFDSTYSLTGANADARVRIKPSQQVDVVLGLAAEVVGKSRYAGDGEVTAALAGYKDVAKRIGCDEKLFAQIAQDLWAHKGESLVVGGGLTTRTAQGLSLQIAVNFLNSLLENDGKTVDANVSPLTSYEGGYADMAELISAMKAGQIQTLLIHRCNPVFALPKDAGFVEALKNVKMVVYMGDRVDETGRLADYLAPDHHQLEVWGDTEIQSGVFAIQQPTIRPLYQTRGFEVSLITWAAATGKGAKRLVNADGWYAYLREAWKDNQRKWGVPGSFDAFWTKTLHEGVWDTKAKSRDSGSGARSFRTSALKEIKKSQGADTELALYVSIPHGDGSMSNLAWLHELPDPVTKLVWDSVALIAPARASKEGLKDGDLVKIEAGGQILELPVYAQVGLREDVVALAVGQGRTAAGKVGNGIGVNAFELAQFNGGKPVFAGHKVSLSKTGKSVEVACTQGHHSMEGRQIVVDATLADYLKDKNAGIHRHQIVTMWQPHEYKSYKWSMSIDLNVCTGCSACVTACQAENNVPVVGKKYVLRGREMHWIRIDRYYSGSPTDESPLSHFQPLVCQQCDNAPCETVCPVAATVHDSEGINTMVYNRCVGTRYCSNNCPYKVRRFNWFNYIIDEHPYSMAKAPLNMALNPTVTVRSRGVMEKCTFCIQRIDEAKNDARDRGGKVKDGEIQTACEQSCPTQAIVFGDINDPTSRVARAFKEERAYALLEETNVQPAVRYLAHIRNADRAGSSGAHGAGHADQKGGHH